MLTTIEEVLALPSVTWEDRHLLPDQPGLYFVITDTQITYIGMTAKSLRSRWKQRIELNKWRYFGEFRVAYAVIEEEEPLLLQREIELLQRFRPPANVRCVPQGSLHRDHQWPYLRYDRPWLPS